MKKKRSKESRERTAEALRRYHANKTDEQKKITSRRMSKAQIERFECMSDAECKAFIENRAKQIRKYYQTAKGKRAGKRMSKVFKKYQASLPEEKKQHNIKCRVAGLKRYYANLTKEEMEERKNKIRSGMNNGFVAYEEVEVERVNDYCGVLTEDQLEIA